MTQRSVAILGIPMDDGAGQRGCDRGPAAVRQAGLAAALGDLGCRVTDRGDVAMAADVVHRGPRSMAKNLPQVAAWLAAITAAACDVGAASSGVTLFLGGDHTLAAGTIPAMARHARDQGRPLFVLWLDAHADFHTLATTGSGNLHGVPLAYVCGLPDFAGLPRPLATVPPAQVCLMGVRSVDLAERRLLRDSGVRAHDMRAVRRHGVAALLRPFLHQVAAARGLLHVSLDLDGLDPAIAPAVGTAVPGGLSLDDAHEIMTQLHGSGLVSSMDVAELNPLLDERDRTARLVVALVASLISGRAADMPLQRHG